MPNVPSPSGSQIWIRRLSIAAAAALVVVTLAHYLTGQHAGDLHNLYRRLYYVPIVLLSFAYGRRGGLLCACMAIALYTPHAFFLDHHDPASNIDKLLEFALYLGVGVLTGSLVDWQRAAQRRLEWSLRRRAELEEQLVRAGKLSALGQLTAGLAHEIRNPLASILGAAEALAEDYPEGHRKHRVSQLMLREIARLDSVVDDFLAFARPTQASRDIVNLAEVAREVVRLTGAQMRGAGVAVRNDLPAELHARGDRGQLVQVLLNLMLNGLQALAQAPDKQVTLVSARRRVADKEMICVGVQDTGPGIADAHREQVFNPYFTTRADGVGLGLSISSRIIENHEGFMDIETSDTGTTVWICLPMGAV